MLDAFFAKFFIKMDDYFCIARGSECVAAALQLLPEFAIVVDLAVKNGDDLSIFTADRLLATVQVNDAQPAHSKRQIFVKVHARIIGSPMPDDTKDVFQNVPV
jgi:hypothetical protein